MKIISFSAIKGGVGKTTLAYNYGEWLADKGNKILFIDIDHQCNLNQICERMKWIKKRYHQIRHFWCISL